MTRVSIADWSPTIRVGMPQVRGQLLDLGLATGLPMLMSANAFARVDRAKCFRGFKLDAAAAIPDSADIALDSAGFVASVIYPDYRWEPEQYLDLVAARRWSFWVAPDYCVEHQVASDASIRRLRIEATATMYYRTCNAAARRGLPAPVGSVQGWFADEYAFCADQMFGREWPQLVAIGSVCRRHLSGPDGVLQIVRTLDDMAPAGTRFHLFGVKSGALLALRPYANRIASIDSMAWDAAVRRDYPTGRTQPLRIRAMVAWHQAQVRLLDQAREMPVGDQPPLFAGLPDRARSAKDIALEALGRDLGDLVASNDLSYLDCKWLATSQACTVEALLACHGVNAFREPDPDDDFGLGTVYEGVREALIASGHLQAESREQLEDLAC